MKFPCIDHGYAGSRGKYCTTVYEGRQTYLHRVIFFHAYGYWPKVVMHRCDNPRCINPLHLQAGDAQSNRKDCVAKGRAWRGRRKLTSEQVVSIRQSGESSAELARLYGVSPSTILAARRGILYREV